MLKFVNHFGNVNIENYNSIKLVKQNFNYHIVASADRIYEYDSSLNCHACYDVSMRPTSNKSTTYDFTIPAMYDYIFRCVRANITRDEDFRDYIKDYTIKDPEVHELFLEYWSEMIEKMEISERLNGALFSEGLV